MVKFEARAVTSLPLEHDVVSASGYSNKRLFEQEALTKAPLDQRGFLCVPLLILHTSLLVPLFTLIMTAL